MLYPMDTRFEPGFFEELLNIWPDPKTREPGTTVYSVSKQTGLSQQTIHNWIKKDEKGNYPETPINPSLDALNKLGSMFIIIRFVADHDNSVDNAAVLAKVKAHLSEYVYKRAVAA